MAAPAAVMGYGTVIGRRQFRLREVEIEVPLTTPGLDGLRLVQLSDIHLSPFLSRADLQWCVDMASETRPHVAFVTGDLITGVRDSIDDCLEELRHLRADAGVFGCNGNHESYVEGEAYTAEAAARRGMRFLRNEQVSLRFGSALLNVAGVDHQWRKAAYLPGAKALLRPGELNLLLSHNPDVFLQAAAQGWDLTLSGHMHGGQINIELANENLNFMRLVTPYVYGTYRKNNSAIYVTRGIGTVGMPVRFGAPPEVALIRLRQARPTAL
jgi:predicted MPP superfamily phosphohydrolase